MKELTKENYATNHEYMSYSRFTKFLACEAAGAANYREPDTPSKLVGSYVDAYFSDEMEEFKQKNPIIFNSKTGELKADFKQADQIITRIKSDEVLMEYLDGEKQKILTGKIEGVPFKAKLDAFKDGVRISDLKVMKDFNRVWSDVLNCYTNFIEAYDYEFEGAIFQELVRQNTGKKLPFYIVAITKEEPADVGVFELKQEKLDEALRIVKGYLPRITDILAGKAAPHRCEKCAYCRGTKKARVLSSDFVGYSGDKLREEGIECDDPIHVKEEKNE